jgi:putative beta-barrel porin BBP2
VIFSEKLKFLFLTGLLLGRPWQEATALLNLEGSRNQIFVFGHVAYGYSSNIFSDSTQRGDSSVTGEVGTELNRRAGMIAVNAIAKIGYQRFATFTNESALNPNFSIEFIKGDGRMTGSFKAQAYRESRSDSAINLRTKSWNVPLGLDLRYPLSDKFYATSQTGYLKRTYSDNPLLLDYHDYSEAVDLFYVYTSKLDLLGGYRVRLSKTTTGADTYDHWFNVGATGALMAKLDGTVRFGYEIRDIEGGENFDHFNVLAALDWTVTRKFSVNGQVSRDFNTIATGTSVDSTVLALRGVYSFTRKFEMGAGIAYGRNIFLGRNQLDRQDDFFTADINAGYKLNDHFRLAVSYAYLQNWSTLGFSDFDRHGFSASLSSRF